MLSISDLEEIVNRIDYKNLENRNVLITGANGFLASNIVHVLMYLNDKYLDKKCTIIALCRNRTKAELIFSQYLHADCFELCIQSVEKEINLSQKIDYVIHAASCAVTSYFTKYPVDTLAANIVGTYNLLDFFKDKELKAFLFFSSGAVCGKVPKEHALLKEDDVFKLEYGKSINCYAEGKRAGEALCNAYWEQYKVPAKVVRIGHTYGPGIDINDGRVFSDFIKRICNGEKLVIKGNGMDIRPFCYITDAIVAFFIILFSGNAGEVYNMVNKRETVTIYELAKLLTECAFPERNLTIEAKNLKVDSNLKKVLVDTGKLEKLGWKPQVDIIEGFRRTVKSIESENKLLG